MYSEIQQAVSYLCGLLAGKLPRRKLILLAEHLSNSLLQKYQSEWDSLNPTFGTASRVIRATVDDQGCYDAVLTACCLTVPLDVKEVSECLPVGFEMSINPGAVSVRCDDESEPTVLGGGNQYQTQVQRGGPTLAASASSSSSATSQGSKMLMNAYMSAVPTAQPIFEGSNVLQLKYTVGAFATTRFGTLKVKADVASRSRLPDQPAADTPAIAAAPEHDHVNLASMHNCSIECAA